MSQLRKPRKIIRKDLKESVTPPRKKPERTPEGKIIVRTNIPREKPIRQKQKKKRIKRKKKKPDLDDTLFIYTR